MNHAASPSNRIRPLFAVIFGAAVVVIFVLAWTMAFKPSAQQDPALEAVSSAEEPAQETEPAPVASVATTGSSSLRDKWGIEVLSLGLTQEDATLVLQYKIVDSGKAARLAKARSEAYLVDPANGDRIPIRDHSQESMPMSRSRARSAALTMPHAGGFPPPTGRLLAGNTFSVLLRNSGGTLHRGSRAVLVVAASRSEELTVE